MEVFAVEWIQVFVAALLGGMIGIVIVLWRVTCAMIEMEKHVTSLVHWLASERDKTISRENEAFGDTSISMARESDHS